MEGITLCEFKKFCRSFDVKYEINDNIIQFNKYAFFNCKAEFIFLPEYITDEKNNKKLKLRLPNFCSCFFQNCSAVDISIKIKDTSNVTHMTGMFADCISLRNVNIDDFNTSNVKDMSDLFYDCFSLRMVNMSNFNTKNVISIAHMFENCESLLEVNMSNLDTANVITMRSLFENCTSLKTVDLANLDTSSLEDAERMFKNCIQLQDTKIPYNIKALSQVCLGSKIHRRTYKNKI